MKRLIMRALGAGVIGGGGNGEGFVTSIASTVGVNAIPNGNFAAWTDGNPDGFTIVRSAPNQDITQVAHNEGHGGAGSGAMNIWRAATGTAASATVNPVALAKGAFYRMSFDITRRNSGTLQIGHGSTHVFYYAVWSAEATPEYDVFTENINSFIITPTTNPADVTVDNVSMLPITNYRSGKTTSTEDIMIDVPVTVASTKYIGVLLNVDDWNNIQNCIMVCIGPVYITNILYHNAFIFKCVNGTWSEVGRSSDLSAFAAGKRLRVVKCGEDISVYYASSTSTQYFCINKTISDATIINNNIIGQISTDADGVFGAPTISDAAGWKKIWVLGDSKAGGVNGGTLLAGVCTYFTMYYQTPGLRYLPGQTWAGEADNIASHLSSAIGTPDYVYIILGVNDVTSSMPADEAAFLADAQAIVDAIVAKWASVKILIGHTWRTGAGYAANIVTINGYIDTLIASRAFCYAGPDETVVLEGGDGGATYMTVDGVHPNETGYASLAAALEAAIAAIP